MPELPEVETLRKGLIYAVLSRTILSVDVRNSNLRFPVPTAKLKKTVAGTKILHVKRRAKYLLIELNNHFILIFHLGMSGRLILLAEQEQLDKHDHILFQLDRKEQLRFRDPRRFGMIDVISKSEVNDYARFAHVGIEPLSKEFTTDYCLSKVGKSQSSIKNVLLDASFIAGIGNIYANESLFSAKIHPDRITNSILKTEWGELIVAIKKVLQEAIHSGGTTLEDDGFRNILGLGGRFQVNLQVYGKAGKNCPVCGDTIIRLVHQGRSSFCCESCQK